MSILVVHHGRFFMFTLETVQVTLDNKILYKAVPSINPIMYRVLLPLKGWVQLNVNWPPWIHLIACLS